MNKARRWEPSALEKIPEHGEDQTVVFTMKKVLWG